MKYENVFCYREEKQGEESLHWRWLRVGGKKGEHKLLKSIQSFKRASLIESL